MKLTPRRRRRVIRVAGYVLFGLAIVAVLVLPMAYTMGSNLALVAGALFGGSIFGDHASPISDTTIMSCSVTGCDIIDHIKTQLPYVCSVAGLSVILYVVCGLIF